MRHRTWQSSLAELIARRMTEPFAWGSNDCCLFAADCVQAMTGVDPAAGLRTYKTETGAARILAKWGGLEAIAAAHCGEQIPPSLARIGDVVLCKLDRECLGICTGETWHAPSAGGLIAAPMSTALKAWRV